LPDRQLGRLAAEPGWGAAILNAPAGIEIAERRQGGQRLLFLLNHTDQAQEVALNDSYVNLLDGAAPVQGIISLAPERSCC